jgi:hypothetical protein
VARGGLAIERTGGAGDETFAGTEASRAALRSVLTDAVRSHLLSDVPLGAFLSGGVDSSLVVGLMAEARAAGQDVLDRLRRAGVRRARARAPVAQPLRHRPPRVRRQPDGDRILDAVSHFDEPFADSSAIPTWYVSEMARGTSQWCCPATGVRRVVRAATIATSHTAGPPIAFDRYSRSRSGGSQPLPRHGCAWHARQELPAATSRESQRGRYLGRDSASSVPMKSRVLSAGTSGARSTGPDPETRLARHFDSFSGLRGPAR